MKKILLLAMLPLSMKAQKQPVKDSVEKFVVQIQLDTTQYKKLLYLVGQIPAANAGSVYEFLDGTLKNVFYNRIKIPKNEN